MVYYGILPCLTTCFEVLGGSRYWVFHDYPVISPLQKVIVLHVIPNISHCIPSECTTLYNYIPSRKLTWSRGWKLNVLLYKHGQFVSRLSTIYTVIINEITVNPIIDHPQVINTTLWVLYEASPAAGSFVLSSRRHISSRYLYAPMVQSTCREVVMGMWHQIACFYMS